MRMSTGKPIGHGAPTTMLDISCDICLFADDTSFTWSNPNITTLHRTGSEDLVALKERCNYNLLGVNMFKLKLLLYVIYNLKVHSNPFHLITTIKASLIQGILGLIATL